MLSSIWHFCIAAPSIGSLAVARRAAEKIFRVLDSEPILHKEKSGGIKFEKFEWSIVFSNVHFSYPSRPDVKVFKFFNIKVK